MIEGTALYRDGRSARQATCKIVLDKDQLHLYFNGSDLTFLIWDCKALHTVQLLGDTLTVHYGDFPSQSLQIEGSMAHRVYESYTGNGIIKKVTGIGSKKSLSALLVLVISFVLLALAGWFLFLPWVADKAANYIPVDTEVNLGESLSTAYSTEDSKSDTLTFLLQEFANQLKFDSSYKIKTEVLREPTINAFALPGGKIFVFSGIIESMDDYTELVALLGHEASHVSKRHSLKSICRSAAGSMVIAAMFGDVTGISSGILSQADQLKQLDYSRSLESEADAEGLKIMTLNRVSGSGMVNLLKLLKKESTEMPAMMKYLSTHPDTDARITAVQGLPNVNQKFPRNAKLESLFKQMQAEIADSGN